jgi:hypothetical protein
MTKTPYGFFHNGCNDVCHSASGAYLTSSTSPATTKDIKGFGTYMYKDNFRLSIGLFGARSLIKRSGLNNNDVYIGKEI